MLLLINTTKTMDIRVSVPHNMSLSQPELLKTAQRLVAKVSKMTPRQLADLMVISDKLAAETHELFRLWGKPEQLTVPALFGFTGLFFKHLDANGLSERKLGYAQKNIRILSGLYGLLKPLDMIEAYRLEMGYKLAVDGFSNLTQFWKDTVTVTLKKTLTPGKIIVSVASQEYMKALDLKSLEHPVIMPVFKEIRPDGTYKNAGVHGKMARGALVRYAIEKGAEKPMDLMGFSQMGWKATEPPPENGSWLFTRPF